MILHGSFDWTLMLIYPSDKKVQWGTSWSCSWSLLKLMGSNEPDRNFWLAVEELESVKNNSVFILLAFEGSPCDIQEVWGSTGDSPSTWLKVHAWTWGCNTVELLWCGVQVINWANSMVLRTSMATWVCAQGLSRAAPRNALGTMWCWDLNLTTDLPALKSSIFMSRNAYLY